MITLGITGRSGCGKSTVTAVFAGHGVPLADADQISREILLPGSPLLPALAERFGADILKADGTLDRRLLCRPAGCCRAAVQRTSDRRRCVPPVLNERFEKDSNGMPQYDPAAAHERRMARAAARRRAQQRRRKRRLRLLILCLLALVLLVAAPHLWHRAEQLLYPRKYEQLVDQWAQTYNLDPLLVDAFIRTESGFDPVATSSVDARGLMQMTEETFLWLRSKIAADEDLTFADLYDPDTSIRFGCYYLHLCLERYNGDVATAAAAYHSGWGTVDNLLRMEEHSADGQTLQGFPYSQMNHYVNKITSCYGAYQRIYAGN